MRIWKSCPQNRNYEISNDGLCRSKQSRFEGKYLRPAPRTHCMVYVLCKNYSKTAYPIRHLVYTAFVGDVPKGYIVAQKDGDRFNNDLQNLCIMPLADKLCFFAKRRKKIPKIIDKIFFTVNGETLNSHQLIKKYPQVGTRQNLIHQANRWLNGKNNFYKKWNPNGFQIKDVFIQAQKIAKPNKTKNRLDAISKKYKIKKEKK